MPTTRKPTSKRSPKTCTHPNAFIVYPGEITIDRNGLMREDDMRLDCPDCRVVTTYTGP